MAEVRRDRLIAGARTALPWLSGVSPRRLRWLGRFAAHGWTQRDVELACAEVLTARGWSVPRELAQPAAFLWALLREVDPGDRPTALIEAQLAEERARREWLWQTRFSANECPHGQPAGDLPHPIDGHLACPFCRKDNPR